MRFKVCSTYAHHRNPKTDRRGYVGEIDAFAIFCPETDGVYLVPIDDVQLQDRGALRVTKPRNNQRRKIRFARDYEIGTVRVARDPVPGHFSTEG